MKKILISLSVLLISSLSSQVLAEEFSYLSDLTPVQKQKLSRIYHSYKQENNSLEMRISSYKDKLNKLNANTEMPKEQVNMLKTAYERNLSTLSVQQEELKKQTEELYKSVMSAKQYQQHQAQQLQTQNAFNEFLRK